MGELSGDDWRRLLDCVGEFYALDDPQHFRDRLLAVAHEALPADCARWLVADSYPAGEVDSLCSGRDISDSDRLKLSLLRPHISLAYAKTQRALELRRTSAAALEALAAIGKGVIALDEQGRVVVWTEMARALVARYFGEAMAGADQLPVALMRWLRQSELLGLPTGAEPTARKPYVTDRGAGGRLTVYWLFGTTASQRLLLLEETLAGDAAFVLAKRLGLTARRAEVLLWVTLGKTSPEIAAILGLSVGTINKHMEHILAQLGVTTRTAAALQAMEALNQPGGMGSRTDPDNQDPSATDNDSFRSQGNDVTRLPRRLCHAP